MIASLRAMWEPLGHWPVPDKDSTGTSKRSQWSYAVEGVQDVQ